MKKYKWIIILANLVLLLIFFNGSLIRKEAILSDGKLILLQLAPVDPRSLMQGDYMALNYDLSQVANMSNVPKKGFCVAKLQSNGVAVPVRLQEEKLPLANDECLIKFTFTDWRIKIGGESFFFQEGDAEKYTVAKYGGIRIDDEGTSLLFGLYDEKLKKIE